MKSQSTFERVNFLKRTEAELMRLFREDGAQYSRACEKYMKRIYKQLSYELYLCEEQKINREVMNRKMTPKEGQKKKAAIRRKYLGLFR